jgi:hypothetical protein
MYLAVVPFGGLLLASLALALRHRARARAEEAIQPGDPLVNGRATVFGKVEGEPSDPPVVVVRIHQHGTEASNKGQWSHTWKETGRDVEARPFTLVRADGQRVRVEPDERVVLHENLVTFDRKSVEQRDRVAAVAVGADVHVTGELTAAGTAPRGAYRASGDAAVLRPPRREPMVVADEPSGSTDRQRMRFHLGAALGAAAALAAVRGLLGAYIHVALDGRLALARPTELGTWQTYVKPKNSAGYWVKHYGVRAEASFDGAVIGLESECDRLVHECLGAGRCSTVPFLVSKSHPEDYVIGDKPGALSASITVVVMMAIAVAILYPLALHTFRPWYLRKKVNDSGPGRLHESM